MVYHLLYPLTKYFGIFNVTQYITFRAGCAFITSFVLVMLFWKVTLRHLKKLKMVEKIDMYGHVHLEALHESKRGTPTMGGILIVFSVVLTTLLWGRLDNAFIWFSLAVMVALGGLGFLDDMRKVRTGKGLSRKAKLFTQIAIGLVVGVLIVASKHIGTTWHFPFFKKMVFDLGIFYAFWFMLIIVSTSNAVNFTDGLDGLAVGVLVTNFLIFALLSYLAGHFKFAGYLFIPYIPGSGELTVLCLSLVGAGLGFLWFNSYPAQVFMGDVGALSLGGVIGVVALLIKQEFLLFIVGGIFVMEAASVILQILSVRLRKKKIFRAAPLHHHCQLLGWKESKVIVRFWIISLLCAVAALLTLKLR